MLGFLRLAFDACTDAFANIKRCYREWQNTPSLMERTPWDAIAEHCLFEKYLGHLASTGEDTTTIRPLETPAGKIRVELYDSKKNVAKKLCACWEYVDLLSNGGLDWVQLRERFGLSPENCAIIDSSGRQEIQSTETKDLSPISVYVTTEGYTKPLRLIEPRWSAIVDSKRAIRLLALVFITFLRLLVDLVVWRIHYEEYEFDFPLPEELVHFYQTCRKLPFQTWPAYPPKPPTVPKPVESDSFVEEQAVARYLLRPLRQLARDPSFSSRFGAITCTNTALCP
ncbi:hypothetical protein BKA70DRAFT_744687 [Coprinopsis sp. MPI-PUGE-AT-0042]|nr:hypothetical protein BKA70DRAFT_744687 [Coprinopsis sp. MPI-PUGE-AT-0042]